MSAHIDMGQDNLRALHVGSLFMWYENPILTSKYYVHSHIIKVMIFSSLTKNSDKLFETSIYKSQDHLYLLEK